MLQVYDRVLTSCNVSTLVVITLAAVVALATLAVLEWIRSRLLIRAGVEFERMLSFPVLDAELRMASALQKQPDRGESRDVQTLRTFLGSNAVFAFLDMPWMPIYFLLIFILHPAMGMVAVAGGALVLTFGILTQRVAAPNLLEANSINWQAAARTDVLTALMDIRAAREVFMTAREGLKAAEESYAMANNRYTTNVGTITELLDAQTRLTEAEVRISKALVDFQIARSKLYFHMGLKNTALR